MVFYLNPNDITNGEIFLLIALQEKRISIKTSDILLLILATRALLHSFVHVLLVLEFSVLIVLISLRGDYSVAFMKYIG